MLEIMICYAILGDRLSEPLKMPVTYNHMQIAGLLQNHQYICSPVELGDIELYESPKTVRERLQREKRANKPSTGKWPKGYVPYDSFRMKINEGIKHIGKGQQSKADTKP